MGTGKEKKTWSEDIRLLLWGSGGTAEENAIFSTLKKYFKSFFKKKTEFRYKPEVAHPNYSL